MLQINLAISLFSALKVNSLECLSLKYLGLKYLT